MKKKNKILSIISSFKNEEESINYFVKAIDIEFKKYKELDYKIYFVNDFSTDRSEEKIIKLMKNNKKIILASTKKNYGHTHSIHYSFKLIPSNTFATVIDCDLQDPVALITKTLLYAKKSTLYHFVRKERYEKNKFQLFYTHLAYKVIVLISFGKIIPNSNYFKIIPPSVIKRIKKSDEIFPYWNYFISQYALKHKKIFYSRNDRKFGYSKFNIFSFNPWITFYGALSYFKFNSYVLFSILAIVNFYFFQITLDNRLLNIIFQTSLILQFLNISVFSIINLIKIFMKRIAIKAKIYK